MIEPDLAADWSLATTRQGFRRRLLKWFGAHARDLPWRRTRDIYAIWVSEVMLQQTQVATVIPYFERFVQRFPSMASLASADELEVLRHWEGLGYYRRARQLHAAAKMVVTNFDGRFPTTLEKAQSLPGIGRYTAGAILSIALDARLPVLEANTIRLLCRLLPLEKNPKTTAAQKQLWDFSALLLPRRNVGAFNQALMELGSTVCLPRNPSCGDCPVAGLCPTRAQGKQDLIPLRAGKKVYSDVVEAALVVTAVDGSSAVLLRQCGPSERWAGLWDFPRFAVTAEHDLAVRSELKRHMRSATRLEVEPGPLLARFKHGVTRYRITLLCYHGTLAGQPLSALPDNWRWVAHHELEQFPLSATGRKISKLVR